jgi:hypothetical protein
LDVPLVVTLFPTDILTRVEIAAVLVVTFRDNDSRKRHGTAHHYEAKRYKPGTLTEEVANIYKAQEKAFKKDGWVINFQKCLHCKGAGMVLSEQQNVW